MHKLKKTVLAIILLISITVFSQKKEPIEYLSNFDMKTVRWGFHLGLNNSGYKLTYAETIDSQIGNAKDNILVSPQTGFNVGLLGDLRLHKNINLRLEPGFYYASRNIDFNHLIGDSNIKRSTKSSFLYVPLLVQFSANRYKNIRPYVAGGVAYGYNFTSNFDHENDFSNGKDAYRLQKNIYFYEIGIGMDFYFYFFKFSPSIRGVFAINNELQRDEKDIDPNNFSYWTTPIKSLGTRGIFIRFAFQ